MSSVPRSGLVRSFRTLFEVGTVAGLTDGQLLERFVDRPGEAGQVAFEAIVTRHGPMVLGVCRRALTDPNDVADAFQATFLVLVRKARSIRVEDSLGRWLYGVSRKVAARARLVASRRPQPITGDVEALAIDPDRFELSAILDEELARLPESFRSALVLCDLEGLTHEEAARDLLCPVGTIKSRLSRGRQRLRERLERRGLVPSLMMLAPPTVPRALASSTIKASVLSMVAGKSLAGVVPASAVVLADGVLKTMTGIKLKLTATIILSLGVATSGAGVLALAQSGDDKKAGEGSPTVVVPAAQASVEQNPAAERAMKSRRLMEEKLDKRVSLSLVDSPLDQAVEKLMRQTGLNIIFDPKALSDNNLTPQSPVSIEAHDLPVLKVLSVLVKPLLLEIKVEDDAVLITTPPRIDRSSRDQLFADISRERERAKAVLARAERSAKDPQDPAVVLARKRLAEMDAAYNQFNQAIETLQSSGSLAARKSDDRAVKQVNAADDQPRPAAESPAQAKSIELARQEFPADHWINQGEAKFKMFDGAEGWYLYGKDYGSSDGGKQFLIRSFALIWVAADGKNRRVVTCDLAQLYVDGMFRMGSPGSLPPKITRLDLYRNGLIRDNKDQLKFDEIKNAWSTILNLAPKTVQSVTNPKTATKGFPPDGHPTELRKIAMPEYVVEPPDILSIEVFEALPGQPITGEHLIRPDGRISLGFYGEIYVAGLTTDEVKEKVAVHLRTYLDDEKLGLSKKNPETGKVEAVPPKLSTRVFVQVTSYNSKVYYVQGDVGVPGRLPITGNETVLDAINFAGGLIPTLGKSNIRLVRPGPPGTSVEQVLPVNLSAIVNNGDTTTNYQVMPGDRVVVSREPVKEEAKPEPTKPEVMTTGGLEARIQTVEKKLDDVLKILEKLPKP